MKQTIEEAAKQYAKSQGDDNSFNHFSMGAHSQASKDFHTQGMYSEEDVNKILTSLYEDTLNTDSYICTDLWFEEHKKKRNEEQGLQNS
jgi:hypothetical protein